MAQVSQGGGIADRKSVETSQSPGPGPLPTLLRVLSNIRATRDQVFRITGDVTWSAEQFNEYGDTWITSGV